MTQPEEQAEAEFSGASGVSRVLGHLAVLNEGAEKHETGSTDQTKAQMQKEGANLSWQSQLNLKSNAFGYDNDYFRLKKALTNLGGTSENITHSRKKEVSAIFRRSESLRRT